MGSIQSIGSLKLGGTDHVLLGFTASEALSEMPTYRAEILAGSQGIDALIGEDAEIAIDEAVSDGAIAHRGFAGVVTAAEHRIGDGAGERLVLTLTPWLGLLAYGSHSALYQDMTSVDILRAVLKRHGLERRTLDAKPKPAKRATCIQYRETDLDFVQRIMAEDNIAHFPHDGSKPASVILHDAANPYPALKRDTVKLTDLSAPDGERMVASDLTLSRRFASGKVVMTSFATKDAKTVEGGPARAGGAKIAARAVLTEHHAVPPGGAVKAGATARARQVASREAELTGRTEHPALHIGQTLDIEAAEAGISGEYVVSALEISCARGSSATIFRAVPKDVPLTPPHRPRPHISGVHTAMVVGDKAGQPACDAEGRVRVRFAWDTSGADKDNSGWIRVAETLAGGGYGGRFTPRVGQEVLVSFLQGDPDAPVITGRVYNGKAKPPFATRNTTKSGIVTRLDGPENALEFDDKKDAQCLALRAGKDFTLDVKDGSTRTIAGAESTTIGKAASLDVGEGMNVKVAQTAALAAKDVTVDAEAAAKTSAKTVVIEADSSIELKVGSSSIKMTSSGVVIDAPKVTLNATTLTGAAEGKLDLSSKGTGKVAAKGPMSVEGLNVSVKAQVKAEVKGTAMAEISGSGLAALKGGLVQIN